MKLADIKKDKNPLENIKEISITEAFIKYKLGKIPIILESDQFIIDIEDLVRLGKPNELSDAQIEEIIERITATRVTFAVAEAEGNYLLEDLQSDFNKWYASKSKPIVDRFGRISDDKILFEILSNKVDAETYSEKKSFLGLINKNNMKLKSLQWILNQRVSILESILDRRYSIKKGKGKDAGL